MKKKIVKVMSNEKARKLTKLGESIVKDLKGLLKNQEQKNYVLKQMLSGKKLKKSLLAALGLTQMAARIEKEAKKK